MPPRHEPLVPPCASYDSTAPPAIPPRPWIGRRPVCGHTCSRRIRASVPYRNPNELLRARRSRLPAAAAICCVRKLHRELSARSSTSKPLAAASAFSASSCFQFRAATGPHARPSSDGPALIAYAEQSPANATVKQSSPRSRRSLVQRRRTAAASGERTNANLGKRICLRQTEGDAKRQEPR